MIILVFIAKMLVSSGLLYGYYYLFLRNKRFHQYNRFYILLSTAVSFIIPFINIPISFIEANNNVQVYRAVEVIIGDFSETANTKVPSSSLLSHTVSIQALAYLVYITGVFFLMIMMIKSLIFIKSLSKKYTFEKWQYLKFYSTHEEGTPFSFFNSIYWHEKIDISTPQGQQIFRHELYHVLQLHTADILFMEIMCIIAWFNPFFHLARRELKAIHEFLADQYAVSGDDRCDYAELLVLHTMASGNISITDNFFNNHIKRRITMLTNFSNGRYNYWSRIMSLPLGIFLFCFISLRATPPSQNHKMSPKQPLTVVIDAGHGGVDPGAQGGNFGMVEKNINLDISKKIEELSKKYNIKVVMTREVDELPGGSNDISESLKKRISITRQAKPDLFISIHINYDPQMKQKEGFDIYVPSIASNNPYLEKSKIAGSILLTTLQEKYHIASELNLQETKNIFVLNQAPCPAIMISCGYLSNENDLKLITGNENQEGIARKILEGIVKYGTSLVSDTQVQAKNEVVMGK